MKLNCVKQVSNQGKVLIPKPYLHWLDVGSGDAVEVSLDTTNNVITISKADNDVLAKLGKEKYGDK